MNNQQLTIWPDTDRAMPNCFARSALFNIEANKAGATRELHNKKLIAAWKPVQIVYSGEQLRQDDADVWLQLVHLAREDLTKPVIFTARGMLNTIESSTNGAAKGRLFDIVARLQWSQLKVIWADGMTYGGPLVFDFMAPDDRFTVSIKEKMLKERNWQVRINPLMAQLFMPRGFTLADWETRKRQSPVGKWLHFYVLSHAVDAPVSLESLRLMSGSSCTNSRKWKQTIATAMTRLQDHGAIQSFEITDAGLTVQRTKKA